MQRVKPHHEFNRVGCRSFSLFKTWSFKDVQHAFTQVDQLGLGIICQFVRHQAQYSKYTIKRQHYIT